MGVRDDLLYRRVYIYVSRKIYIVRHLKYSEKLITHTSRLCLVFWFLDRLLLYLLPILRSKAVLALQTLIYTAYVLLRAVASYMALWVFMGIYRYLWVIICQITEVAIGL